MLHQRRFQIQGHVHTMDTCRRHRCVHLDNPYQAAHTIVPEHTHQHNTHKRRRCTLPAASENDEAGPSRSVEIPVPYLRTRRCRDPLLAASVVQQDSSSGFQGSSNASLRTQRTLNHDRQLRASLLTVPIVSAADFPTIFDGEP